MLREAHRAGEGDEGMARASTVYDTKAKTKCTIKTGPREIEGNCDIAIIIAGLGLRYSGCGQDCQCFDIGLPHQSRARIA